ncbi:MAG TPA: SO2930 family diheme c-type cytochrome [Woeseiaceae bacterium]|nr:SO2930 family diheme c-type cytochrome [Woeseiaceae bacterium]
MPGRLPATGLLAAAALATLLAACGRPPPVAVHPADTPPERLSDWGVVLADGRALEFNDGVIPYDLNTPLFSDYALKLRSVWMPAGASAQYRETGEFEFPVGTILSKTFHYERAGERGGMPLDVVRADRESGLDADGQLDLDRYVLVETRLLVRYDEGWQALPYVWNDTQDEAFLELAGDVRNIRLNDGREQQPFVYVVPDANQCGGCHKPDHTAAEMRPLGPRAWQLNREYRYPEGPRNQIEHWSAIGMLAGAPESPPEGVRWAAPGDASPGQRARAYLDANCAHCHNANGPADTSGLDLGIGAPLGRRFGICKPPVAVGRGSGDRPYDIYPGRPDDSILLYRMAHSDPAIAMPELGRSTVHREGVELVRDWIAGLAGDC